MTIFTVQRYVELDLGDGDSSAPRRTGWLEDPNVLKTVYAKLLPDWSDSSQ